MDRKNRLLSNKFANTATIGLLAVIIVFITVSLAAVKYENEISALALSGGAYGMAAYVMISMIAVIIAPISAAPLIPLASAAWGWVAAAMLSIIGWTAGAQIAFYIARHFGKPLVAKIASIGKLEKIERSFPKRARFWAVVFLRTAFPVDLLSYALGMFSNIGSTSYFFATLIGITPFAFIFAYAGTLPIGFQLAALLAGIFIVIAGWKLKIFKA